MSDLVRVDNGNAALREALCRFALAAARAAGKSDDPHDRKSPSSVACGIMVYRRKTVNLKNATRLTSEKAGIQTAPTKPDIIARGH
jgi:hypothetical protein